MRATKKKNPNMLSKEIISTFPQPGGKPELIMSLR